MGEIKSRRWKNHVPETTGMGTCAQNLFPAALTASDDTRLAGLLAIIRK